MGGKKEQKMTNKRFELGILAVVLVFGMTVIGCGGSGAGSNLVEQQLEVPKSAVYESKDTAGNVYILEVTNPSRSIRAAYTPKSGDIYTLTIILVTGETRISNGTVTVSGATLELSGGDTLTITISGDGMTSILGTITLDNGVTLTPVRLEPRIVEPKTFTLNVNWERDGWDGSMELSDITSVKPKAGYIFKFKISGTTDKTLEKFGMHLDCQTPDWMQYQWLGGSGQVRLSGTFEQTFDIEIGEDPKDGYVVHLHLSNDAAVPASARDWAVMATISNFEVRLVGIEEKEVEPEDYIVGNIIYDRYITDMADATSRTDFSFIWQNEWNGTEWVQSLSPLSKYIDGQASVKITGGDVILNLGTPKLESMISSRGWYDENNEALNKSQVYNIWNYNLSTSDSKYILYPAYDGDGRNLELVYSVEDQTVTGNQALYHGDGTVAGYNRINMSLRKGWNWVLRAYPKNCVNDYKEVEIPKEKKWSWHERKRGKKKILSTNCWIISTFAG